MATAAVSLNKVSVGGATRVGATTVSAVADAVTRTPRCDLNHPLVGYEPMSQGVAGADAAVAALSVVAAGVVVAVAAAVGVTVAAASASVVIPL